MAENQTRDEKTTSCSSCGAEIHYTLAGGEDAGAGGEASLACPSCGRPVAVEGADPRLTEFGPGLGQSGA